MHEIIETTGKTRLTVTTTRVTIKLGPDHINNQPVIDFLGEVVKTLRSEGHTYSLRGSLSKQYEIQMLNNNKSVSRTFRLKL